MRNAVNTTVTKIPLRISNAYLVRGSGSLLVDTGSPNEEGAILRALAAAGVHPTDLSLILHTHVHVDHVGSTAALRRYTDAPVAYHDADDFLMQRGNNGTLKPTSCGSWLPAKVLSNVVFQTVPEHLSVSDGTRLDTFGVRGRIMHTPGHTPGSISLVLDDGAALVGDLLMGGWLAGKLSMGTCRAATISLMIFQRFVPALCGCSLNRSKRFTPATAARCQSRQLGIASVVLWPAQGHFRRNEPELGPSGRHQ
jgi:hypothetical protein